MRKAKVLSKKRSKNFNEETLTNVFNIFKTSLGDCGIITANDVRSRIFSTDETGMGTNPNQPKMFFKKETKSAFVKIPNKGKSMYTVLMCGSADDTIFAPLVVYKGKHLYNSWTGNGPENAFYASTISGWMEDTVFQI